MTACQRIEQTAIVEGYSDLRYLDWPALDSLPEDLLVRSSRPFELGTEAGANQIVLNLDPQKYGAILFRVKHNDDFFRVTNIPFTIFSRSHGFNWGYGGNGPHELALNIINTFVPPGADGKSPEPGSTPYWGARKRTFASATACELAQELLEELVSQLPVWGGYISGERLKGWIIERVARRA